MISQYNSTNPTGPRNIASIIKMRIRMEGFVVIDHAADYPKARAELSQWIAEGKLKKNETIVKGGLKEGENALLSLFKGSNTGKLIVEVKDPKESPSKL